MASLLHAIVENLKLAVIMHFFNDQFLGQNELPSLLRFCLLLIYTIFVRMFFLFFFRYSISGNNGSNVDSSGGTNSTQGMFIASLLLKYVLETGVIQWLIL